MNINADIKFFCRIKNKKLQMGRMGGIRIAFAKFADFCFCVEKYGFIEIGFLDFRLAFVGSHKNPQE